MATETLVCRRFHARYRLPRGADATRERLDHVLADALGAPLERALARRGLRSDEEICVRDVEAHVRLRLAATDGALAERWSAAVADAIAGAVELGGPDVVRYGSRRQALHDLVLGAARGDLTRAWAWRRLGVWPAEGTDERDGDAATPEKTARAVTDALLAEATAIVPVLAAVAGSGALPGLLSLLPAEAWSALAVAAGAPAPGEAEPGELPAARAAALRAVRSTALGRAAAAAGGSLDAAVLASLAGLVVLEEQPWLAVAPGSRTAPLAAAVRELLGGAVSSAGGAGTDTDAEPDPGAAAGPGPAGAAGTADPEADAAPGSDREPGRGAPRGDARGSSSDTGAAASEADAAAGSSREPGRSGARGDARGSDSASTASDRPSEPADLAADGAAADEPTAGEPAPSGPPPRVRDVTHWGALLFLLNLVDELGLPAELAEQERPLRWSLHRLALLLAPLEADDPAALAFAGLAPDSPPPSEDAPPPTPPELELLAAAAERVTVLLRARLDAPPEQPDEELVEWVCRRAAEVVADPGWIELRFSGEDAETELRRALLDLDPGWLPWLGCVVRFVYV